MPAYSEPLCQKCLHLQSLHTHVVARLPQGGELRRCTVSICPCIVTLQKHEETGKEKTS
ncbi:MAG TPA: hypothetical protein VLA68_07260 [Nitrososphaera sp.]|nr:hypothetical protein [Nitrososphaera sp.]